MSGAKLGASGVHDQLAVIDQVRWSLTSQWHIDESGQLVVDPLLHRKPVQAKKNWWDVVASASSRQKVPRRILDRLHTASSARSNNESNIRSLNVFLWNIYSKQILANAVKPVNGVYRASFVEQSADKSAADL